jgi:DNA-binding XRE family transcriptional regulator
MDAGWRNSACGMKFALYNRAMMKGDSKYQPLREFLSRSDRAVVTLTFAEIEAMMGATLPLSAREKRTWWSNRSSGTSQAATWMSAGYTVKSLDLEREEVVFHKPPDVYQVEQVDGVIQWNGELIRALRSHMGMTQSEFATAIGVRQQTVSEWEKEVYTPTRASAKYLMMVAEKAEFKYDATQTLEE